METTRQSILNILRRREATVDELTKELGLAPATVRRHLDILGRDGHVEVTQVRRKTGRPHYVFSLSEKGEGLFPKHYVRITNRMIDEIAALTLEETAGRSGAELADVVFDRMARRLAQQIAPQIHGSNLNERIDAVREALADEGIAFDVERVDGDDLLIGHGCPCPRLAGEGRTVCAHDQRLLGLLLGVEVTPEAAAGNGWAGSCAYRVRAAQERVAGQT
jgi:predicted ArsR family transcriptional regulator